MNDRTYEKSAMLKHLLDALHEVKDELSLPQLVALGTIAAQPGISVNELGERISAPQQSASRYVAILLGRYESVSQRAVRAPLIRQEVSAADPRSRALYLSDAGSELIGGIIDTLAGHNTRGGVNGRSDRVSAA